MPGYLISARPGAGKSLMAVQRALDYLREGRRVVANFPIDFASLSRPGDKIARRSVEVIPPCPTASDLLALGRGGPSEERAGLLIFDEAGKFLNSREWNASGRKAVLDWFTHYRKLKWDVILITQHSSQLDKQIREAIPDYLVMIRRMDRHNIPFTAIKLPRLHYALVKYGLGPNDPVADRWLTRGTHLFGCYQTEFSAIEATDYGWFSMLPPWHVKHRYLPTPEPVGKRVLRWMGFGEVKIPSRPAVLPAPRLKPLMRLNPDLRWMAARQLVMRGVL